MFFGVLKRALNLPFKLLEAGLTDDIKKQNQMNYAPTWANTAFQYHKGIAQMNANTAFEYNKAMEQNKYKWAKEGMLKAGLNPGLMTGGMTSGWIKN